MHRQIFLDIASAKLLGNKRSGATRIKRNLCFSSDQMFGMTVMELRHYASAGARSCQFEEERIDGISRLIGGGKAQSRLERRSRTKRGEKTGEI